MDHLTVWNIVENAEVQKCKSLKELSTFLVNLFFLLWGLEKNINSINIFYERFIVDNMQKHQRLYKNLVTLVTFNFVESHICIPLSLRIGEIDKSQIRIRWKFLVYCSLPTSAGSGSIFCGSGWVVSAIYGLGLNLENSPKNVKFFNFFPFGSKKISLGRVRKYPGRSWVGLLFILRVKSKLGSGKDPSLLPTFLGKITSIRLNKCTTTAQVLA